MLLKIKYNLQCTNKGLYSYRTWQ